MCHQGTDLWWVFVTNYFRIRLVTAILQDRPDGTPADKCGQCGIASSNIHATFSRSPSIFSAYKYIAVGRSQLKRAVAVTWNCSRDSKHVEWHVIFKWSAHAAKLASSQPMQRKVLRSEQQQHGIGLDDNRVHRVISSLIARLTNVSHNTF